jgi:predicted phosphodiesterase
MKIIKLLAFGVISILFSSSLFAADYVWIQYGENDKLIARAISKNEVCPLITIDGKKTKMNFRAAQENVAIKEKITVCEYDVTLATSATIDGDKLKLPPKKVKRFVVIGDTGCEYSFFNKKYRKQQCDEKNWPFKNIANKVAQLNPDFVIHIGDYMYRDKYTNPEDAIKNKQMQWSFFKDDFFDPAKNLLKKSPMIFIRGNHESCKYGGDGWFAFLEPRKFSECLDYTDSYNVHINDLQFTIFDSSASARGAEYSAVQLKKYSDDFAKLYNSLYSKHWLLIHQPVIPLKQLSDEEKFVEKLHALVVKDAFKDEYSSKLPVSIAGHYHVMAYLEREKNHFTQLIVGNGGTMIHQAKKDKYNLVIDEDRVTVNVRYGYTVFDRLENYLWKATSYDINGNILLVTNLSTKN